MKLILDFLNDLRANNNREWFNANKGRYKEAEGVFNVFAEELIALIGEFDADDAGAHRFCAGYGAESDRPSAENDNRIACIAAAKAIDPIIRHAEGFDHRCCKPIHILRKFVQPRRFAQNVLGHGAV